MFEGNDDSGNSSIEELIRIATDPSYDAADPGVLQQGAQAQGAGPSMDYRMNPSYMTGGVVQPGGDPRPTAGLAPQGAQQGQPIPMQQMEAEMQRMVQDNPQEVLKIKAGIEYLMQQGELTPEELNMAVQLATAAAQNPALWPQLRQFALQQGFPETDIPEQYDSGMVFTLLLAARAVQNGGGQPQGQQGPQQMPQGGQGMPQSQGQPPQATLKTGGPIPDSRNKDGSVAINAHKGEYMIPEHVVLAKGTDFFDKMIGKDDKAST